MALFGRNYDRDYGWRGSAWNRRDERENPYLGMTRNNWGWGGAMYDRDYGMRGHERGYDRGYKSRWQTDFGDPYGDRAAHTPMRMMRGPFRGGYDRGWHSGGRSETGYGRDYHEANPMSYDPYGPTRQGTWMQGRSHGRGYDSGWF